LKLTLIMPISIASSHFRTMRAIFTLKNKRYEFRNINSDLFESLFVCLKFRNIANYILINYGPKQGLRNLPALHTSLTLLSAYKWYFNHLISIHGRYPHTLLQFANFKPEPSCISVSILPMIIVKLLCLEIANSNCKIN